MRFCTILIAILFLLPFTAQAQYNSPGNGYQSRNQSSYGSSTSTRVSGRAIGKLVGAVIAGGIALFGFLYRLATGGGATTSSPTTNKQGPPPDFSGFNAPR